ncbi:PPR_long domain-containing protein [Durusdinium trenchii]|uniref:PPR_long domain-containing protein n=1 Tax=Durusdinium trenchii TaxID=1381693 RepID=A0ABP0HF56_9DINO
MHSTDQAQMLSTAQLGQHKWLNQGYTSWPPVRDPAPLNALLAALATGAQWSLGLTLLRAVQRAALDVWGWNSAIHACGRAAQWRSAWALLDELQRRRLADASSAAGKNRLEHRVVDVWFRGKVVGFGKREPWWPLTKVNAAISACDRSFEFTALPAWPALVGGVKRVHPKPDVVGFSAAIAACAKRAVWRQALHLWLQLFTDALSASLASLTSFGAAVLWTEAMGVLKTHVVRELKRLKMWKLFFKGWLFPRHVARSVALELGLDRCLALLASAMREPALADRVTCAAVAEACASAVAWATALHLASLGQPPVAQIAAREAQRRALELAQVSVQLPRTQVFGRLAWRRWQDTLRTPSSSHPEEITLASAQGRLLLETRQIGVDAASSGASRSARCSTAPFAGDILLPEPSRDQLTVTLAVELHSRQGQWSLT